jgi:hypothetical protein
VAADPEQVDLIGRHLRPGRWCAHFWQGSRLLVLFHDARFDVSRYDRSSWGALLTFAAARGLPTTPLNLPTGPPAPAAPPASSTPAAPALEIPALEIPALEIPAPASAAPSGAARTGAGQACVQALVLVDDDVEDLFERAETDLLLPLAQSPASAEARPALAALRRLRAALDTPVESSPASSSVAARRTPPVSETRPAHPRVFAPNGRWEHAGLRLAALASADLEALRGLLLSLSAGLLDEALPHPVSELPRPRARMGALARLLAVLDLPPDHDTRELSRALDPETRPNQAPHSPDIVLTHDQERSFQRLAHRVTMLLTESDPLHRFLLTPDS